MKTLVIGYGNSSRRDDGVGWYVIDRLRERGLPGVDLRTEHQLEVDLAETIREYDVVIFVDAAIPTAPHRIERQAVRPQQQSHAVAHYLTPADLLALCQTLYGVQPVGFLFSIRGENFHFGETLTPAVAEAAGEVVREIRQMVALLEPTKPVAVHA